MNPISSLIAIIGLAGILAAAQVQAVTPDRDKDNKNALIGTSQPSLEGALFNFNLFEQQPEPVIQMVSAAWDVLSVDPNASYADLAQNSEFQDLCKTNGMEVLGGPLLGCITADGATVWIRTLKPAQVEVTLTVGNETRSFGPVNSTFESDLTALIPVSGLKPNTLYTYRVLVDGKSISLPAHAAIVTAPEAKPTEKVCITFGSCFHRWGLGNQKQVDLILRRNPSAMLLLGDIAAQDRENHLGLHRFDYLMRDQYPAWQDLVCTVPVYATWDDHDYFNNDKTGIPPGYTLEDKQNVCDVYKQAWNNPSYGFNDERRGVFQRTRIGPCDVIMVDNRYFRVGNRRTGGDFLGEEQMQWLEEQLLDCKGPFIILSCGSMWSDYVSNGKDSWGVWDAEARARIFNLI
jgi:alkaline phosphatase D